jgi:DNA replication protein DnaC
MIPKNKIKRIKSNITRDCANCNGDSCSKCISKACRIDNYASANIPSSYWLLAFKDFEGDSKFYEFVTCVLKDIDKAYDNGYSYLFTGGLGTGKTYAACSILKMSITLGYASEYTTMATIINSILSKDVDTSSYIKNLIMCDFLVIDEFDPRWIFPSEKAEQMFGSSLEHILRMRFQNATPTILCSNAPDVDTVLSGKFAKAFKSLRARHLKMICVGGVDFRRRDKDD